MDAGSLAGAAEQLQQIEIEFKQVSLALEAEQNRDKQS